MGGLLWEARRGPKIRLTDAVESCEFRVLDGPLY